MSSGPVNKNLTGGSLQILSQMTIDRNRNATFNDVCILGDVQMPSCMEITTNVEDYDMVLLKRPNIISADFVGDYAPENWTLIPNGGSVIMGNTTATLVSANNEDPDETLACIEITTSLPVTFVFDWSYTSYDIDGPEFDPFGVTIGDQFLQISDDNGGAMQTGSYAACLPGNEKFTFCFAERTTDGALGNATVEISGFHVVDQKYKVVSVPPYELIST